MSIEQELKASLDRLDESMTKGLGVAKRLREDRDRVFDVLSSIIQTHPEAPIPLDLRRRALEVFQRSFVEFGSSIT